MTSQILISLKQHIEDVKAAGLSDAEALRNVVKEDIQYYILDYIYHHPKYSTWTMYGGSALRICHGLNRMSVDLDFEIDHSCTEEFLNELEQGVTTHFLKQYALGPDFLTIKRNHGRGLKLVFFIADQLGIEHTSKQVHVKIDLNHFIAQKTVIERIPINHNQLAFTIKTYNMSSLMASKIAAVFSRGKRIVGKAVYEEKGRDIYDLLWYMEKRIIPDLDYLSAKEIDISDLRVLFDRLTLKMNNVSDDNLRDDLSPLFVNSSYIKNWLAQWHDSYLRLVGTYNIHTITTLKTITIRENLHTDNISFTYFYETEEHEMIRFEYTISDYWIGTEGKLPTKIDEKMVVFIAGDVSGSLSDTLKQYTTLFYTKTKEYLHRTNGVIIGSEMKTKLIRATADNLNQKEQIVLDKSTLLSCELEDLLK